MKSNTDRKNFPFKLLVEGTDDLYVVANIRDRHNLADNFDIIDCKGVSNIPDQVVARIKQGQSTVKAIGIILDADNDLDARWQSIHDILKKEGYEVPTHPDVNGTILSGPVRNPTIGIWLMPDNLQSRMLEDFVMHLIPPGDLLQPYVNQILADIESQKISNRYDPNVHRAKAFIHTWLARQIDPGKPMGTAISATFLDHNTDLCLRFVAWLNRLFNNQ